MDAEYAMEEAAGRTCPHKLEEQFDTREMDSNQPPPPNKEHQSNLMNNQGQQIPPANQIAPHLMGLMTNPALAAAASPLFPPAAFLSNPAAYLAIPDAFGMGGFAPQQQPMYNSGPLASATAAVAVSNNQPGNNKASSSKKSKSEESSSSAAAQPKRDLSAEERAQQNRDRNREHARSTRLRKKAYVQKLKELVEGLHAERTEEVRQRRVAIQQLAEVQNVRRSVIRDFLHHHAAFESDPSKWETLCEEDFWLKQPVTPFRAFRRSEIENESRVCRGIQAVIADAASLAVMVESIGSRSARWLQRKRQDFLHLEEMCRGNGRPTPRCIAQQESRLNHAISSLSSSYGSNEPPSSSEQGSDAGKKDAPRAAAATSAQGGAVAAKKAISSSSGSSNQESSSNDNVNLHDYHNNKPLPDPKIPDAETSSGPSAADDSGDPSSSDGHTKRVSTESSSSGDDSDEQKRKRRKVEQAEIAATGGIPHNIRPPPQHADSSSENSRLSTAPAIPLPPFAGLGKKRARPDGEVSSSTSTVAKGPQIYAEYHVNDDSMVIMEDVVMCPFVFRSHDAVTCGALAECVVPGMLRASFSSLNRLKSLEFVYDSMGLMQQLERASGNEGLAQIVPSSLEQSLTPTDVEARVITLAKAPYRIVNVNDLWTKTTGYTQMEVEGEEYLRLLNGEGTIREAGDRRGKPLHRLEEVAKGRAACSTNIHYARDGRDFIEFVASYPLTNASDEITHLLHVSRELPIFQIGQEVSSASSSGKQ